MTPNVIAIVAAKDEAPRIGRVIDALLASRNPALAGRVKLPVLVVDDGSTDSTAQVALNHGAMVLRLPKNVGKGEAMRRAVEASRPSYPTPNDTVLFVDADLLGFRPDHVDRVLGPVSQGPYGMVVGMRDYGPALNPVVSQLPLISGERAVRRSILDRMPPQAWSGYAVETWLNHIAALSGLPVGTTLLDDVSVVLKWNKDNQRGNGYRKMVDMGAEVARAHVQAAQYPLTLQAGPSTDDVMESLTRTLVRVGGPYVREHIWTPEAQRAVGEGIGRRLAAPLWALACVACGVAWGPAAGLAAGVGALAAVYTLPPWQSQRAPWLTLSV